jgi:hypothetical protein
MSEQSLQRDARRAFKAANRRGTFDRFLLGLVVLLTLARASEALAGDQAPAAGGARFDAGDWHPSTALSAFAPPDTYQLPSVVEPKSFPSKDFRPHGRSIFDADSRLNVVDEALMPNTTIWQRLSEFRTHDRVQLLTLWESRASTISLQTGKRGDPSLQWTSRLMNRGGATRGLLDRLFPVSVTNEGIGSRAQPRPANPQPSSKGPISILSQHFGSSANP